MQEGPENISVFDLISRTTAALEAYNRHLGTKIFSHADFFVLCLGLLEEEKSKARDFDIVSRGGQLPDQKRPYRLRDKLIRKLNKQLVKNDITVSGFLDGIVFNKICKDKCNFDLNASFSSSDVEDDSEQAEATTSSQCVVLQGNTCVVCMDVPSDVILNCGHFKFCITCFETQQALHRQKKIAFEMKRTDVEPLFKCPFCNTIITQHLHVPKIYN